MKIKRLTIFGFKSFVDRTTLAFPVGTSAIVGPNGCGKSNIVDAIRWVLGEQNPRHLRGRLMEDVIFSGSESRKPMGMAEVVLTLSNEEGRAPQRYANFTEIEVSRRLYRSGESEYYINRVPSRLRDIVDLFTDTGIGTRAYSIIEQGQVGWLVNAKPEERRVLFEEAAGINRFKQKKEAALRRLEATRENLTRVSDIISEVKRQLNSLNRQAKKAERYKLLKEELKDIELFLASGELERLRSEMAEKTKRLEEAKRRELDLTTEINLKEGLIEQAQLERLKLEEEFSALKEKAAELERAIQEDERTLELGRMRIEELGREEQRLSTRIEELRRTKAATEEETAGLRREIEGLETSLEQEARALRESEERLERILKALSQKEELLRSERAESVRTMAALSDLRHAIQSCLREEENLRIKEAMAQKEREEALSGIEAKRAPVAELRKKIDESKRSGEELGADLSTIRGEIERLETVLRQKHDELRVLEEALARSSSRLSALEEMEKNFEYLKEGVRAIMLNRKRGVHGLIADVIETNPGYEKAVETVLGERLQYVIVESQKEGVEAIEYLKTHCSGRGTFIPIRDTRQLSLYGTDGGGSGAHRERNGARSLMEEVSVKEGYAQIVNFLLGDVLLVEDLDKAVAIWRQNGITKTLVTPDGEMIDPHGIITGGFSNGADAGILQKRGEIKRLRAEVEAKEGMIAGLREEIKRTEAQLDEKRARFERIKETLHNLDIEKVNLEGDVKIYEDDIKRLEGLAASLEKELEDIGRRFSELRDKKDALSSERDALEEGLREKEAAMDLISGRIKSLNEEKDLASHLVTEKKVALAQMREKCTALKGRLSERERLIEDTSSRVHALLEDIERGRNEAARLSGELKSVEERIEALLKEKDELKAGEVAKSGQISAVTERIGALESETKELKARLSELLEAKGAMAVELKETELGIEHLKERIRENYGVEPGEHAPKDELRDMEPAELEERRRELKDRIASLGEVNLAALEEYSELQGRYDFLLSQQEDLNRAIASLMSAISKINRTTRERFKNTFDEINDRFKEVFPRLFNGGRAELRLPEDTDVLESGIEIVAQPPGKRLQNLGLLSGGEKALTATALIFSIFLIKPSPFCLLDEVDAPLDDANIDRFNSFVKELSRTSQFILITHNKRTMEIADTLYGITMEEPGVSKVISVEL